MNSSVTSFKANTKTSLLTGTGFSVTWDWQTISWTAGQENTFLVAWNSVTAFKMQPLDRYYSPYQGICVFISLTTVKKKCSCLPSNSSPLYGRGFDKAPPPNTHGAIHTAAFIPRYFLPLWPTKRGPPPCFCVWVFVYHFISHVPVRNNVSVLVHLSVWSCTYTLMPRRCRCSVRLWSKAHTNSHDAFVLGARWGQHTLPVEHHGNITIKCTPRYQEEEMWPGVEGRLAAQKEKEEEEEEVSPSRWRWINSSAVDLGQVYVCCDG